RPHIWLLFSTYYFSYTERGHCLVTEPLREICRKKTAVLMVPSRRMYPGAESSSYKFRILLYVLVALLIVGLAILGWVVMKKNEHIEELENQVQTLSAQVRKLIEKEQRLTEIIEVYERKVQEMQPPENVANVGSSSDPQEEATILKKASMYIFKLSRIYR
ncbi:hypothetical protein XELAEV_18047739mg, partial [Xenopus laevis]